MKQFPVLLFCTILLCTALFAQTSAAPDASVKTCTLSGKVVKSGTTEAVRKAKVELIPSGKHEESEHMSVVTDQDGQFRFEKVLPKEWTLQVERPGFAGQQPGAQRMPIQRKRIALEPGQQISDLLIPLVPASTLTGRVLDQDGEPMPQVSVSVMQYRYNRGKRRSLTPVNYASTNDLGEYRMFGLAPGQYYVMVSPTSDEAPDATTSVSAGKASKLRYPATYYPGAFSEADAVPLKLTPGEEVRADFSLAAVPTVKVSGRVLGLGQALDGFRAMVMLAPYSNTRGGAGSQAMIKADQDTFELEGVLPGTYNLVAYGPDEGDREKFRAAKQKLVVGSSEVNSILLTLESMGNSELKGSVIMPNGKKDNFEKIGIRAMPANWRSLDEDSDLTDFSSGYAQVAKDGTFNLKLVGHGTVIPTVYANDDEFEDYYTKTVRFGGRDITDTGLNLKNKTSGSIEIVLSADGGRLEGFVLGEDKKPFPEASVVLVPIADLHNHYELYQTASSDQKGHFLLRGIRPGSYKVYAWEELGEDAGGYYYDEFLSQYENSGQSVKIEANGKQTVTVAVIPSSNKVQ